jgi:hypothetical protein
MDASQSGGSSSTPMSTDTIQDVPQDPYTSPDQPVTNILLRMLAELSRDLIAKGFTSPEKAEEHLISTSKRTGVDLDLDVPFKTYFKLVFMLEMCNKMSKEKASAAGVAS